MKMIQKTGVCSGILQLVNCNVTLRKRGFYPNCIEAYWGELGWRRDMEVVEPVVAIMGSHCLGW